MNKKYFPLLIISAFLFSSCSFSFSPNKGEEPEVVEFSISEARFTDEQGHLKVTYECNYDSPFDVDGHKFGKLNITGVTSSELNYSTSGYFTLLSPIVSTSLKFEFIDNDNVVYISTRYANVILYNEPGPIDPDPEIDPTEYPSGYTTLYWHDEFDGEALDQSSWSYQIGNGDGGWGNGESQYYTNSNEFVSNGELTIRAKKENVASFNYTSSRLITRQKVHFTYGYVEAKISLPDVVGMWPAFWMMPNDSVYGGWPHSGEIDIMEAKGRFVTQSSSAIHFSTNAGQHTYLSNEKNGHNITQYHKYAVEWKADTIRFFIDDVCHLEINNNQWGTVADQSSQTAPFDKDFYIILNLAVGGHFDDYRLPPDSFTSCDMKVDYVRVFK